jgi:very-short-patch-repair endonuclease
MSVHEAQFATWLDERDIPYIREMAIDKYNVDFALDGPIAVEILGGEWHGTRKKTLRHSERTPQILDAGWLLLFVWATPAFPLTPTCADYTVALLKEASRDPSLIGEYRVIRGDAQLLARARAEDYHRTGIPSARKGSNTIG